MATLHVRNVPDELYEALRARAEAVGDSISGIVVATLAEAFFAATGPGGLGFRLRGRRPRRPLRPFERLADDARAALVAAQREARALGHNYLGTEHLLLGLLGEGDAVRALATLDVDADRVREAIVRIVGRGDAATEGAMPFTPRAKKVLELALREAFKLGRDRAGTEHLLLALSCEGEGVAARILREAGADDNAVRVAVTRTRMDVAAETGAGFCVVELEGSAEEWTRQLTAAAADGYELVSILGAGEGHRAVFRAA